MAPSKDSNYSRNPKANTIDPGPHFVAAKEDPGERIVTGPNGESYPYTDATGSESTDDPLFPGVA